jgi:hypothetical protein
MKPLQQVFALVLEQLPNFRKKMGGFTLKKWKRQLSDLRKEYPEHETYKKKEESLRNKEVKAVLFDKYLRQTNNMRLGNQSITSFFNSYDM